MNEGLGVPQDQTSPGATGAIVDDDSWRAPRLCAGRDCGTTFSPKRKRQRYAPGHTDCRRRSWEAKHPRLLRKNLPAMPARRLKPTALAILGLLMQGPVKVTKLWEAAGPGFSTRVSELRKARHRVEYDSAERLYRLLR